MADDRSVTRLMLRQFKSIERCDLELGALTVLVGRNGVGKSNLIDALRFVADALRNTLEYAVRERGGIDQVRRRSMSKPTHPVIGVDLRLSPDATARYEFSIGAVLGGEFRIDREACQILDVDGKVTSEFLLAGDAIKRWKSSAAQPAIVPDRLLLVALSGVPEFRPVYDTLARMTFHNLNPEVMKFPQRPEPGHLLAHDGRNLASVIKQLQTSNPAGLDRVAEYLRAIGVDLAAIRHKQAGSFETVEVDQAEAAGEGSRNARFEAIALSDGTVRALGILVSLVSARGARSGGPTLIGIEEPETALHPAAAGALMDALAEGAERTQLVVTCHSPDLLDHESVRGDVIRPVLMEKGKTVVGRLDPKKTQLIQDHLTTAGELLRLDQLEPDPDDLERQKQSRGTLWESVAP